MPIVTVHVHDDMPSLLEISTVGTATVSIDSRFNGPPASGNGGYACGVLGTLIGSSAEVTLRKPPPLDTAMTIEQAKGQWTLSDGETAIATGHEVDLELEVPAAPSFEAAQAAESHYAGHDGHIFPTCFVCGPDREPGDGLRLFTGKLDERDVVASHWLPGDDVTDAHGQVDARVVWGALDCPTYFGGRLADFADLAVLGRLAAKLVAPVRAGERHVVIGWPLEEEEKRWSGGSAIYSADGELCAFARGTWVRVKESFPGVAG